MNKEPSLEKIYRGLCTTYGWLSNCEGISFSKKQDGWSWDWQTVKLDGIAKSFGNNVMQKGFKTRKDAAEYAQSMFGDFVDCSRFHEYENKSYIHPDYFFDITKKGKGWTVFHDDFGMLSDPDGKVSIFKTRRQAISAMIDKKPEFFVQKSH